MHTQTPNRKSCFYNDGSGPQGFIGRPWSSVITLISASSRHPGGANVAFADGSVHFIKSTIASNTWWAIGTANRGEVLSSGSY
jgi:prepilin-type processing-associated H-X9-DG protein